jgi:hypothetical protein
MKIEVVWHDEARTIILQRFFDGWTADDYYATFALSAELLKQEHGTLRGIFTDCTYDGLPPRNMMGGYKKALTYGKLPFVMVNPHPVSRMLFESVRKAYKVERAIYYAQSLSEAEELLNQHYEQLSAKS